MMNRRRFSKLLLGGMGTAAFASRVPPTSHPVQDPPRIDGNRLRERLREMSRFGRRADGGVDRVAFSDADLEGRRYFRSLMEEAGLGVQVDPAGNLRGRHPGRDPSLPPLWVGSHLDSVPAGGNYDGTLGALGALEAVLTLDEAGISPRHPVDVVVFVNEEGGKTGSRILAGEFRPEELELETASGFTIREGIRRVGGDPSELRRATMSPGSVAGFLELHIEQGAVLEKAGERIGVVEGIVGIRRWTARVHGAANHAGTTPMDQRRDALLGASALVQAVNRAATALPGTQVATVGRLEARPGAPNVIPGRVDLSIEIRALEMDRIQEVFDLIEAEAGSIADEHGTPVELDAFYLSRAAPTDPRFRDWVEASARELGLTHRRMPSGAGHDAQAVAHFAPTGMIFIPSQRGVSHHPDEYSRPEDVEAGVNVLLGALLRADAGLDAP